MSRFVTFHVASKSEQPVYLDVDSIVGYTRMNEDGGPTKIHLRGSHSVTVKEPCDEVSRMLAK